MKVGEEVGDGSKAAVRQAKPRLHSKAGAKNKPAVQRLLN